MKKNKLKPFTNEAFYIAPKGEIIKVPSGETHISMVIKHPEKFGITKNYLKKTYIKHKEKLYCEGNAREEIIKDLYKAGWIRCRRYLNKWWSIQFGAMNAKIKKNIANFALTMLTEGVDGYIEQSKYFDVKLYGLDGAEKIIPFNELANGGDSLIETINIENYKIKLKNLFI